MSIVIGGFFQKIHFFPLLDVILGNAFGEIGNICGNCEHNVYVFACELVYLGKESAQSLIVCAAHFEYGIDVNILNIVISCNETCNETEESLKGINAVVIGINKSYIVTYIVSQLSALVYAYNIAVGILCGFVDLIDEYLGFSRTLFACNDLDHNKNSILSGKEMTHDLPQHTLPAVMTGNYTAPPLPFRRVCVFVIGEAAAALP